MSITWSAGGTIPFIGGRVAFGQIGGTGVFVVASESGLAYSTDDGATWTDCTPGFFGTWTDVAFGNGVFVAVSVGLDSMAATSPDGINWTQRALSGTSLRYDAVAYGNGRFVAFPRSQSFVSTSDDGGATWVQRGGFTSGQYRAVIYANGLFLAASNGASQALWSADGETWTSGSLGVSGAWESIAYGSAGFLLTESQFESQMYLTSPDATTWTSRTYPAPGFHDAVAADQLGNYIVLISGQASSYFSSDGINWTTHAMTASNGWQRPGVGPTKIVAAGTSSGATNVAPLMQDLNVTLGDELPIASVFEQELTTPVNAGAVFADAFSATEVLVAAAHISLVETTQVQVTWLGVLADALTANDTVRLVFDVALAESIDFDALLAGDRTAIMALVDTLLLADGALTSLSALAAVSDAMALVAAARSVVEGNITDSAALADLVVELATVYEDLVVAVLLSEEALGLATVTVLVNDSLAAEEALSGVASYIGLFEDSIGLVVSLTLDGIPYVGMAMNAANKGVSEYDNYDYNSLAEFGRKFYGAGAAGLYRLEGDTDAGTPISARIRTALLRLGDGKHARIDSAYLGYRSDGTLKLKVVYMGDIGEKRAYVYDLQALNARDHRAGRIKVGKGLKSVYWAFELSNTDGADFDLDTLEVLPLVLNRRLV